MEFSDAKAFSSEHPDDHLGHFSSIKVFGLCG